MSSWVIVQAAAPSGTTMRTASPPQDRRESDGLPRWEVGRQLPPRAAPTDHIQDRVHDRPAGMFLRTATGLHRRQQRLDDRPLPVTGVRRVPLRAIFHPATVDHIGGEVTQARRAFSNTL